MSAEVITDLAGIDSIEETWRGLAERTGNAFVTPEWFRAWWEQYGEGLRPAIGVSRDPAGEITAVLPLVDEGGGRLRFAGANLGDVFGLACAAPADEDAAADLASGLAAAIDPVAITLDYVLEEEAWPGALARDLPGSRRQVALRDAELPYIAIDGADWDGYLATRTAKFRKRLRYLERALTREHELAVTQVDDAAQVGATMDHFFALHDARWAERGGSSLSSNEARAVHRAFATRAHERGWLRLRLLELDGAPVAAFYGWRLGGRYSFYQSGFDPSWAKSSVGLLVIALTVRDAIQEGAQIFDFLLGSEDYKSRFTEHARAVRSVALVRPWSRARFAFGAEAAMRRIGGGVARGEGPLARAARAMASRLPSGRRI